MQDLVPSAFRAIGAHHKSRDDVSKASPRMVSVRMIGLIHLDTGDLRSNADPTIATVTAYLDAFAGKAIRPFSFIMWLDDQKRCCQYLCNRVVRLISLLELSSYPCYRVAQPAGADPIL